MFATPTLADGPHVLKVWVTGLNNPASFGRRVSVDAVHVVSGSEVGQGIYTIVSANNKLDLEVNGASKANGGVINHYHGSGSANTYEHWYLVPIGDGFYRIVNVNSWLDMEIDGTSGLIDQYQDVAGATNEHWTWLYLTDSEGCIRIWSIFRIARPLAGSTPDTTTGIRIARPI